MKRTATFFGLLAILLLLAACGAAGADNVDGDVATEDVDVLVYASPL